MDIITLARELGKEIQKDERYLSLQVARQNSDEDEALQQLIGDFNLKRLAISNEGGREDRDEEKLQALNEELRDCYDQIMRNPNMLAYNAAKEELDLLLQRVNAIVGASAQGGDPETADYEPQSACGGDCSGCAGCH